MLIDLVEMCDDTHYVWLHTLCVMTHTMCDDTTCGAHRLGAWRQGVWDNSTDTLNMQHYYSAVHCNTLQRTVTHCNTLQHVWDNSSHTLNMQHYYSAVHCNTLQHTTTHCNTLQHTATHCNTCETTRLTHSTHIRIRMHIDPEISRRLLMYVPLMYMPLDVELLLASWAQRRAKRAMTQRVSST